MLMPLVLGCGDPDLATSAAGSGGATVNATGSGTSTGPGGGSGASGQGAGEAGAGGQGAGGAGSSGQGGGGAGPASDPVRTVYSGTLDSSGNATVSVPSISINTMPLVVGYVFSNAYAEPGYLPLGNIIPGDGSFRFAAGATNAGASYSLVVVAGTALNTYAGTLDGTGDATVAVPEVILGAMPLMIGYVFTSNYAEPGYVPLGNIIPGDGSFRFAAGATNAGAPFRLVVQK